MVKVFCRVVNQFSIRFRNSCNGLRFYHVVQVYFTHLFHHRCEGFESEVQGQNLSRFTKTEALKTPQNSLGEMCRVIKIPIAFLFFFKHFNFCYQIGIR